MALEAQRSKTWGVLFFTKRQDRIIMCDMALTPVGSATVD